jgi:hypothetical protein
VNQREVCPECGAVLERLLADEHGGQYYRCPRSGFHWVEFNGDWYRDFEWRRFVRGEEATLIRQQPGRQTAAQWKRNPLRRPDW